MRTYNPENERIKIEIIAGTVERPIGIANCSNDKNHNGKRRLQPTQS
jgi:hypothetical protein